MKRRVVKGSGEDKALNQEGDGGRKQQRGPDNPRRMHEIDNSN
jgi:hypothetical protein